MKKEYTEGVRERERDENISLLSCTRAKNPHHSFSKSQLASSSGTSLGPFPLLQTLNVGISRKEVSLPRIVWKIDPFSPLSVPLAADVRRCLRFYTHAHTRFTRRKDIENALSVWNFARKEWSRIFASLFPTPLFLSLSLSFSFFLSNIPLWKRKWRRFLSLWHIISLRAAWLSKAKEKHIAQCSWE